MQDLVEQLRDEIKSFILAGHETSASMLTWTVYQLTQNPRCLEHVIAESRSVRALRDEGLSVLASVCVCVDVYLFLCRPGCSSSHLLVCIHIVDLLARFMM